MKKIMFDDSMGAAGDMIAAALLDLFDDPDSVVNELNKIIKDANLEEVVADVVKQVRDNVEGMEFDVAIDDEVEEPEDFHPEFRDRDYSERWRPTRPRMDDRYPHPEHRHEHYHDHPHYHDEFREDYYHHRRPCPPRPPFAEHRRPGCHRGPHPKPFECNSPLISGPIELHFHLHLEGDVCKKHKKHRKHHHHHHGKHVHGNRERKNRRSRRNRKPQVKKDTSVRVAKDHFN